MTLLQHEYGNKTMYGITRHAEWYLVIGYHLFVIASSLIGDSIFLLASIKYRVFKLHKVITVIIEHIAICDLMVLSTLIGPTFASLVAGKWIFGDFVGYITYYTRVCFCLTSVLLISAMTTSKVMLVKYPLGFGTKSRKDAHIICSICWMASLTFPAVFLLVDKHDLYFSYRSYHFEYGFSSNMWSYLRPLVSLMFGFFPTCQVIATTVYLLTIAKKVAQRNRDRMRWQGIATTVLTGTVYSISVLPYAIYNALDSNLPEGDVASSFFRTTFYRITRLLLCFNTISNFYIYCLTVSSFRKFLWSRLKFPSSQSPFSEISSGRGMYKTKNLCIKQFTCSTKCSVKQNENILSKETLTCHQLGR